MKDTTVNQVAKRLRLLASASHLSSVSLSSPSSPSNNHFNRKACGIYFLTTTNPTGGTVGRAPGSAHPATRESTDGKEAGTGPVGQLSFFSTHSAFCIIAEAAVNASYHLSFYKEYLPHFCKLTNVNFYVIVCSCYAAISWHLFFIFCYSYRS